MYNYQNKIKIILILGIGILLGVPSKIFGFDLADEIYSSFQKISNNIGKNEYLESAYLSSYSKDPFGDAMNDIDNMDMQLKIAGIQYIENELAANNCSLSKKKIQGILYYFVPDFRAELVRDIKMNVGNINNKNFTFEKSTIEKYCKEYFVCMKSKGYGALETFRKDGVLREDVRGISAATSNDIMTNCKEYFGSAYEKGKNSENRIQELKKSHAGSDKFRNATTDDSPYDIMLDLSNAGYLIYEQATPAITPVFYNLPVFSNSTQSLINNRINNFGTGMILGGRGTGTILGWHGTGTILGRSGTTFGGSGASFGGNGVNFGGNGASFGGNGASFGGNGASFGGNGVNFGGNASNLGGNGVNFGGSTSNLGGNGVNFGGNSSNLGGNSSNLGGNSSSLGGNNSNLGGNSSNLGGNSSNLGGNGVNLGGNSSNLGGNSTNLLGTNNTNSNTNIGNNSQISNLGGFARLGTGNTGTTKEPTIGSTSEILPVEDTETEIESDSLGTGFIQDIYDDLIEGLGSKSIINKGTLFYGSLCEDEDVDEDIGPEIEREDTEYTNSNTGVDEWGNLTVLSDEDYQEVIDYMMTAVNQYSVLPDVIRLRIAENLSNIDRSNTPTTPEEIDNLMDNIKTCRESCEGLRIDQEASCKMMCACDEVTSADDEIFGITNSHKLFDSDEFPGLGPIAIIRFCTVPAVDMSFSVGGKKIVSIEEGINEIFGVVDKLSREGKLGIWTQQNNFLDSTTKEIKISDTVSFYIDVEYVDIRKKYNKSSQQHENIKLKNDNKSWQAAYNVSNPLDNPSYKNQYRIVGYTGENIKDYRGHVDADLLRQSESILSTAMEFYDNVIGDSHADRYISESEDLDKFLDQHGIFWNDMQKYLEDMTQYAEFLYSKRK